MGLLLGLASPNTPVPNSNQEITIGSGWTLSWDYEGSTIGASANTNPFGFLHGARESYFDNQHLLSGSTRNLRMHIDEDTEGAIRDWGCRIYFDEELAKIGSNADGRVRNGETIWLRVKMYFPNGWDWNCQTNNCSEGIKFIRLHCTGEGADGGSNEGYHEVKIQEESDPVNARIFCLSEVSGSGHSDAADYGGTFNENNFDSGDYSRYGLDPVPNGEWHTIEMMIKNDNAQDRNAIYRVWLNGNLVLEDTKTHTARESFSYYDQLFIFTYWNGKVKQTQDCFNGSIDITTSTPSGRDAAGNPYIGV